MTDDDALRRRIAHADPARTLVPLRADRLHRLTENAMTLTEPTPASPQAPTRPARRWIWAGAAAAGAAALAVAVPLLVAPATGTTVLVQPPVGGPAAMCAVVTPEAIAGFDAAFRAQVVGIDDDTVTLRVLERFDGDVKDTLVTTQGDGSAVDGAPLVFASDGVYLISTADGVIVSCGVSGEDTPELDALYRAAFDG